MSMAAVAASEPSSGERLTLVVFAEEGMLVVKATSAIGSMPSEGHVLVHRFPSPMDALRANLDESGLARFPVTALVGSRRLEIQVFTKDGLKGELIVSLTDLLRA